MKPWAYAAWFQHSNWVVKASFVLGLFTIGALLLIWGLDLGFGWYMLFAIFPVLGVTLPVIVDGSTRRLRLTCLAGGVVCTAFAVVFSYFGGWLLLPSSGLLLLAAAFPKAKPVPNYDAIKSPVPSLSHQRTGTDRKRLK